MAVAVRQWLLREGAGRGKRGACDADERVGWNSTARAKAGVKKSLLVGGGGGPLAVCTAEANVNSVRLLADTLDAVVVERPQPTEAEPQHLCLDKAYDNAAGYAVCEQCHYTPHIRRIGEEKKDEQGEKRHPARRWAVERSFAWLSRCRGLLIHRDRKTACDLAQVKLARALL